MPHGWVRDHGVTADTDCFALAREAAKIAKTDSLKRFVIIVVFAFFVDKP